MPEAHDEGHFDELARFVRLERSKVNFEYWRTRADMEQTKDASAARKVLWEGDAKFSRGDLLGAREDYDSGLKSWRKVLDAFPSLRDDVTLGEDRTQIIRRYRYILDKLDVKFPEPFILQDILDKHGNRS